MATTTLAANVQHAAHLTDIAKKIQIEMDTAESDYNSALSHAIKAGEYLIEAKGQCLHGEWLPWLAGHGWSRITAAKYMRLAANQHQISSSTISGALVECVKTQIKRAPKASKTRNPAALKGPTCEKCGFVPENSCQLDVHHIIGKEHNEVIETLCANCHRLVTWEERQ